MAKNLKVKTILEGEISPLRRAFNEAMADARKTAAKIGGYFRKAASSAGSALKQLGKINISKGWLLAAVASLGGAGYAVTKLAADYETLSTSYKNLVGDAEKAKKVLDDLTKFSTVTPFEPDEVYAAGKILLAFGQDANTLIPTLRAIGDIAAGTGVPLNDLAQIYGKVMTKGKAQAEELNQMAERGIPIIQVLADMFGKTEAEIYKMAEAGELSFDVIKKAFDQMTSKGGKFFNMMQEQSLTFNGIMSTLLGNVKEIGKAISNEWLPALKKAAEWANSVAAAINQAKADKEKQQIKETSPSDNVAWYNQPAYWTGKGVSGAASLIGKGASATAESMGNTKASDVSWYKQPFYWASKGVQGALSGIGTGATWAADKMNGPAQSVLRSDLTPEEKKTLAKNRADKAANPGRTIPQIDQAAADKIVADKKAETERRKTNSVNTAIEKMFAGSNSASASNDPFAQRTEFIDKYLAKAREAAQKLGTELNPIQEAQISGQAGMMFDDARTGKFQGQFDAQLAGLQDRLKYQRLITSGKEREAEISKEIAKAEKAAADAGQTLSDEQRKKLEAAAGQIYDQRQLDKTNSAADAVGAKDNTNLADRLSQIGGYIGGNSNPAGTERRENEKVSLLRSIKENTADLDNPKPTLK